MTIDPLIGCKCAAGLYWLVCRSPAAYISCSSFIIIVCPFLFFFSTPFKPMPLAMRHNAPRLHVPVCPFSSNSQVVYKMTIDLAIIPV